MGNMCIVGIPEEEEREKGTEEIFEAIITENFSKLMADTNHRARKLQEHSIEQMQNKTEQTKKFYT